MSDPHDLAGFLDLGWDRLTRGVTDPLSAARHPVFATVLPEARTVVLRAANRAQGVVEVHTDGGSDKIASLRQNPIAQLMIWDEDAMLQIRVSTTVEIEQGAAVSHKWSRVPAGSRMAYGASPKPGTPIEHAHAYKKLACEEWFTVLTCTIRRIELMHLAEPHRRAVFLADDQWCGVWCVP